MARCMGCGSNIAEKSRFCSVCGAEVAKPTSAFAAPAPTVHPDQPNGMSSPLSPPDANGKKKVAIAAGAGAIVMAIALLLFLKAAGVLGAKQTEAPSTGILSAPAARPSVAPILGQPTVAQPSAPVLSPPQVAENPMPDDIIKYLRWLKEFEAARKQLEFKGNAAYMKIPAMITKGMMNFFDEDKQTEGTPSNGQQAVTGQIAAEIAGVVGQMNQATGQFQSYTPPNPCAPLANAYNESLKTKVSQMAKMQASVGEIFKMFDTSGNTNDAQSMLPQLMQEMTTRSMSTEADAADQAANQALNDLRSQYTSMPDDVRSFNVSSVDLKIDPKSMIPGGGALGM